MGTIKAVRWRPSSSMRESFRVFLKAVCAHFSMGFCHVCTRDLRVFGQKGLTLQPYFRTRMTDLEPYITKPKL